MLYGDNGILNKAKYASEEYKNATEEEKEELAKVDSDIQSSRETVTISKEEYESLKPNSIKADSILLESTNENKDIKTLNLSEFKNNFLNNFENYFAYDNATGNLTCKKDGWYFVELYSYVQTDRDWSNATVRLYINDVSVSMVCAQSISSTSNDNRDTNAFPIFLKQGDSLRFEKISGGYTASTANAASIKIIKL